MIKINANTNAHTPPTNFISNKYKPYVIDDFCLDERLKTVLKTLISIEDLNILLFGNPCSGKTVLLNAIVREYYEIPKDGSFPEHNILYVNNLKEQGIGFYRNEMKTFSQSHSTIYGKKKMIIIDDIDTINEQSQQVFRNYIDKYKKNVYFLSVCTNIQKVIENLQSRVHIIRIEPPTQLQIQNLMEKIIVKERLNISPSSKEFILRYSKNSIRTLLNYLEKIYILSHGTTPQAKEEMVELETCMLLCANIKIHTFQTYLQKLKERDLPGAIKIIYSVHDYGFSVIDILELFFFFVKTTDLLQEEEKYKIIKLLCKYITIFYNVHEDIIELALFTNNLHTVLHSPPGHSLSSI